MKHLFLNLVVLSLLTTGFVTVINACHKQDSSQPPDVVASPSPQASATPEPSATPVPTATPVACPEKQAGMYMCYDWKPCNGLFATKDDAIQALKDNDAQGCGKIDGEVVTGGFGPCAECQSVKSDGATMKNPPFSVVLKLQKAKAYKMEVVH